MMASDYLIGWFIVLLMVVGIFLAYLRARHWYECRTWDDVNRVRR